MLSALPRAIKAVGVFSILSGALSGWALSKDASDMNTDRPRPHKIPQPPQSTLDLQDHVSSLRLKASIGYTGDADKDFAALLAVQRGTLVSLARIELAHGTDAELRAVAQRVVDAAPAQEAALKAWRARHVD
ncbi:MAG: hypothetical protein WAQ08_19735 [Aquabacterium sp.]|jgi:uncharacterized protein (DUF305 family)|uniref:hypothetical protein n=1 Tax=Aquabacterium sp. TaxID=1872578 RepID=UPI003BAEE575